MSQGFATHVVLKGIGFTVSLVYVGTPQPTRRMCPAPSTAPLHKQRALAQSGGRFGAAMRHIGTGRSTQVNTDRQNHDREPQRRKRQFLIFNLGLSHNLVYAAPSACFVSLPLDASQPRGTAGSATVLGISRSTVHQVVADLVRYKKPCQYSGKGIRYDGEKLIGFSEGPRSKKS